MSRFESILLGIVQGLTEFLPVSSSGHLVVVQKLLGISHHDIQFDVVVHVATLLSVLTILNKPIFYYLKLLFRDLGEFKYGSGVSVSIHLILGTVPTAIVGLTFREYFETAFSEPKIVGVFFLVTAIILYISRRFSQMDQGMNLDRSQETVEELARMPFFKSFVVGCSQAIAIAPGVSRSGTTIAVGLFQGMSGSVSAYLSFMLAIPAILGASLLELKNLDLSVVQIETLAWGFGAAYFSGVVGLWGVLKIVKQGRLDFFAYYLIPLALLCFFYL